MNCPALKQSVTSIQQNYLIWNSFISSVGRNCMFMFIVLIKTRPSPLHRFTVCSHLLRVWADFLDSLMSNVYFLILLWCIQLVFNPMLHFAYVFVSASMLPCVFAICPRVYVEVESVHIPASVCVSVRNRKIESQAGVYVQMDVSCC